MKKSFRTIVTVATCLALGACSSIGTVNGVNIEQGRMGVQRASSEDLFCDTRPWICILAAVGTIGAIAAIMASRGNNRTHYYHGPA